jgi:hypothetical protein
MAYKGPGEWRSKADQARGHDNPFVALADAARMLSGLGEDQAAQLVVQAHQAGGAGDTAKMAELLRAAARACDPKHEAEAQGLRNIADALPEDEDGQEAPPARPPRRKDEDTDMLPALDSE